MKLMNVKFSAFVAAFVCAIAFLGCGPATQDEDTTTDEEANPFTTIENEGEKADSHYLNPAGLEVEVDLEADITITSGNVRNAPAELGQFALTYLRKRGDFYLESLAESVSSTQRVEWKVDGVWKKASEVTTLASSKLTHFRIRSVNAILINSAAKDGTLGKVFTAKVPKNPYGLYTAAQNTCAEADGHIHADNEVYWYVWDPSLATCKTPVQDMTLTVSKVLPKGFDVYPEYDQLTADKKITSVILFGQIDDGAITDSESGVVAAKRVATWLKAAKYTEVIPAPLGRRFTKMFNGIEMQIDLYSPREFSGLGDYGHFSNFQKAISEHEIIAYDGHSMLGASDFWARPTYPKTYQIYLYGGCLGYEYYVRPIFEGKGSTWGNLDLMSSVVEVSANASRFAVPVLGKITYALTHGNRVSWQQLLGTVRTNVGDSTFGVSGVRENKYCPPGVTCTAK